jgi:hypothetical protein
MFNLFVETLLSKFFKGRDLIIRNNDIRYLVKNTISLTGLNYYLSRLVTFINTKEQGGARTAHQISQVFNLLTYCVELYINKQKEGNKVSLSDTELSEFTKSLIELIKQNLKDEKDEKRNKLVFSGIITFVDRLLHVVALFPGEKLNKNIKSLVSAFEKLVEKAELKNMEKKVADIKGKVEKM